MTSAWFHVNTTTGRVSRLQSGASMMGTRVPVIEAPDWTRETRPVVVFTWNQADAIARKLRRAGYQGAIHAPFPVPHAVA